VVEVRIVRRILYSVLLVAASFVLLWFFPMLMLIFYAGAFVLLLLSRQLNFYRMVIVLKRYAQKLGAKLRFEIRTRLHLGFRDYGGVSAESDEELHRRTYGYVR
jgi:hypothetical protein